MNIVGNVYGKNVVGKQLKLIMVLYIGKNIKKNLDLYCKNALRSSMKNEKKINKKGNNI